MGKRILAVFIASLMIATLSITASAADPNVDLVVVSVHPSAFAADSGGRIVALADDFYDNGVDFVPFGETAYYPILGGEWKGDSQEDGNLRNDSGLMGSNINFWVSESNAVRGAAISKSWDDGGAMVASVSVERKRVSFDVSKYPALKSYTAANVNGYYYFLAVTFKEKSTSTERVDVGGVVSIKKTGTDGFWSGGRKGQTTVDADVFVTLGYPYSNDLTLSGDSKVYYFSDNGDPNAIETNEEEQINLPSNLGFFVVNTKGQGKIVLSCDARFDTDFAADYPDAELDFINGNGASFKRMGTLYLFADEGEFLYRREDNRIYAVDAEYDNYEGAFIVETRTLDSYVISDIALPAISTPTTPGVIAPPAVEPEEPGQVTIVDGGTTIDWGSYVPINPATGATA
jgi:hypothetical protein